jgi:uncharacterized RDD family membrane protein YckC
MQTPAGSGLALLVDAFVIGELMIVATRRTQRLGDRAAGTVVVRTAPRTARERIA